MARCRDPETRARIVAMAQQGVRPALIHREMPRVTMWTIYEAVRKARLAGVAIPPFPRTRVKPHTGGHIIRLAIWKDQEVTHLEQAARARGISPRQLVARVVQTVLAEKLFDAILDDGKGAA